MSREAVIDAISAYLDNRSDRQSLSNGEDLIRLHTPSFGAEEISAATLSMLDGHVTMGEACRQLEAEFSTYAHTSNGMLVNSGSSANLLMVATLTNPDCPDGLTAGDEVIVSALSWSTTVWPLVQRGLVPVIVDIDPETLNIDPLAVKNAIGLKTRAIMPVHVYGNPCNMDALLDLCTAHNLILMEDCCEAIGARYRNKSVGAFGRAGSFSFYFSHHITTLEGGIVVSNDDGFSELSRILRAHGWLRDMRDPKAELARHDGIDPKFLFVNEGFNFRMSNPQAAFGLAQMKKLQTFLDRRASIAERFSDAFAPYANKIRIQKTETHGTHSWFGFPIILGPETTADTGTIRTHLRKRHVETRPLICGNIARQPGMTKFTHRAAASLSHADQVMERGFAIPCHQSLTDDEVESVVNAVVDSLAASA